jgi:hypothetical protein
MPKKITHALRMKEALNKFDSKQAEKVLDLLADAEDNGYSATNEENNLRERLLKCIEAYQRTMYFLEN